MNINILLCDTFPGLLPDYIPSYFSMFEKLFNNIDSTTTYKVFDIQKLDFPIQLNKDDLYLITGSNAGAYDDTPWVKQLIEFIKVLNSEKIRLTGICFGHQIIAQALGGKVVKAPVGWGTGVRE